MATKQRPLDRTRSRTTVARDGVSAIAPLLLGCALAGCDGCQKHNPYVPFAIGSGSAAMSAAPIATASASGSASAAPFPVVRGTAPSANPTTFAVGARKARARSGRVFKNGLALGEALLAWTERKDGSQGELSFFRPDGDDLIESSVAKLPKELDIERCSHDAVVLQIGRAVAAVAIDAECDEPKKKAQFFAALRFDPADASKAPENRLELRAEEPIALEIASEDRDHDEREDLLFTARPTGDTSADGLRAQLVLWDRPAGYAWDPSEPEASLGKLGQGLLNRAVAKKPDAVARAESALAFLSALCADLSGSVKSSAGAPKCQESRVIGDALHAVAIVASNQGDWPRAVAAFELIGALKQNGGRGKQVEALFAKKVKKLDVVGKRATVKPSRAGVLSPLAWDDGGALLVVGEDGVTKVDVQTSEETKSDVPAWSLAWSFGDGESTVDVTGLERRCGPASASLVASARGSRSDATLGLLATRVPPQALGEKCDKARPGLVPIAGAGDSGWVVVDGETYKLAFGDSGVSATRGAFSDSSGPLGGNGFARAPGRSTAIALGRSVLVSKDSGWERWVGPDTVGLSRCVGRASGDRVACLSSDAVVVLAKK